MFTRLRRMWVRFFHRPRHYTSFEQVFTVELARKDTSPQPGDWPAQRCPQRSCGAEVDPYQRGHDPDCWFSYERNNPPDDDEAPTQQFQRLAPAYQRLYYPRAIGRFQS